MKIICMKAEKEHIKKILLESNNCPFAKTSSVICKRYICEACIEKNIEWEVLDDDRKN